MTTLFSEAMTRVSQMSDQDQDAIAALILEEIESEARWDRAFAAAPSALADLGRKALAEHRAGATRPMEELLR